MLLEALLKVVVCVVDVIAVDATVATLVVVVVEERSDEIPVLGIVITVPAVIISLLLQPSYHPATPFSILYTKLQWVQLACFMSSLVQALNQPFSEGVFFMHTGAHLGRVVVVVALIVVITVVVT
jgi:hypothetical protein